VILDVVAALISVTNWAKSFAVGVAFLDIFADEKAASIAMASCVGIALHLLA
jgi:hypothetical protein